MTLTAKLWLFTLLLLVFVTWPLHGHADTLSWAAPTAYNDTPSTPLPTGAVLTYNVYQDGKLLTTAPITALNYALASTCAAHTYQVTAILVSAESPLSAPPTVGLIASTCAPKPPTAVKITAG